MDQTYRIVFRGEILAGHDPDGVRQRAAVIFKVDQARLEEKLFCGRPIVLAKGLTSQQAQQYVQKLENIGMRIFQLKDPAGTTNATTAAPVTQPAQVTCPKCGHVQPKRTLCQQCATDMPAYVLAMERAAKEDAAAQSQANVNKAEEAEEEENKYANMLMLPDPPALLGFDLEGRFTRTTYVTAAGCKCVLLMLALFIVGLIVALTGVPLFLLALIIVGLGGIFWMIRDAVLRLHDLGVSGWFGLLLLIPFVGPLITFVLALLPGKVEDNEYGPPTQPTSMVVAVLAAIPFILVPLWAGFSPGSFTGSLTGSRKADTMVSRQAGEAMLIMYSRSDCSACDQRRAEFKQQRMQFTEYFVDKDSERLAEMHEKLEEHDIPLSTVSYPVFDAYGTLMVDNPSADKVRSTVIKNMTDELQENS